METYMKRRTRSINSGTNNSLKNKFIMTEGENKLNIAGVIAHYSIRSKTNAGELCRQDFRIVTKKEDINNAVLCIRKYVLSETDQMFDVYENYGFDLLKIFKGKRLYRQVFVIKINTLL